MKRTFVSNRFGMQYQNQAAFHLNAYLGKSQFIFINHPRPQIGAGRHINQMVGNKMICI